MKTLVSLIDKCWHPIELSDNIVDEVKRRLACPNNSGKVTQYYEGIVETITKNKDGWVYGKAMELILKFLDDQKDRKWGMRLDNLGSNKDLINYIIKRFH